MPTPVHFHIVSESDEAAWRHACGLARDAWRDGARVFLRGNSEDEVAALDALLWSFDDQAFLPHERAGSRSADLAPIVLGTDLTLAAGRGVLINLATPVPAQPEAFDQIHEVVSPEPARVAAGRDRYRRYRHHGHPLETSKLQP